MSDNKMQPTDMPVDEFLADLDEQKRRDSEILIEIMRGITGLEPVMWGTIIGFGSQHYKYESGREGDMPLMAFSPRKANLTVYIMEGFDEYADLLAKLGKHTTSVSCLYIKKLADVDLDVLQQIIQKSYDHYANLPAEPTGIEAYEAAIPENARAQYQALKTLVEKLLPMAEKSISYQMPAYRIGPKGRPVVYLSAWKDHVAFYPLPTMSDELAKKAAPFIKGKGTFWIPLDQPLPEDIISETVMRSVEEYYQRQGHPK